MNLNEHTTVVKNYTRFNLFRSTAFILPIFFVFLDEHLHLTADKIILISGIYSLLPFFLEIPLGYVADRIGEKKVVAFGLIAQIISNLSILIFKDIIGYQFYLVAIYVASAAFSGADISLIHAHFKDDKEFKDYVAVLNSNFYKKTILFLMI